MDGPTRRHARARDGVTDYWLSCQKFTVLVRVDDTQIIRYTAPISRKFVGQPFDNLKRWASRWGPLDVQQLRETHDSE